MQRTIKRLDGKHAGKALLSMSDVEPDVIVGKYVSALMVSGILTMDNNAVSREDDGTYTLGNGWRLSVV